MADDELRELERAVREGVPGAREALERMLERTGDRGGLFRALAARAAAEGDADAWEALAAFDPWPDFGGANHARRTGLRDDPVVDVREVNLGSDAYTIHGVTDRELVLGVGNKVAVVSLDPSVEPRLVQSADAGVAGDRLLSVSQPRWTLHGLARGELHLDTEGPRVDDFLVVGEWVLGLQWRETDPPQEGASGLYQVLCAHSLAPGSEGKARWEAPNDGFGMVQSLAVVEETALVVRSFMPAHELTARDARDGRLLWRVQADDRALAADPHGVVFGEGSPLAELELRSGEVRWSVDLQVALAPALCAQLLVALVSEGDELHVVGLEREAGSELWRTPLYPTLQALDPPGFGHLTLALANGVAYVGRFVEAEEVVRVCAFDVSDGAPLWDRTVPLRERPIIAELPELVMFCELVPLEQRLLLLFPTVTGVLVADFRPPPLE